MNAVCSGCNRPGPPRPSSVTIFLPPMVATGITLERIALPSTSTVHAPHWPRPQPKRGPCRPRSSRNAYSSGICGSSAVIAAGLPLTFRVIFIAAPPRRTELPLSPYGQTLGRQSARIPNVAACARLACGSGFPIGKPVLGSRRFALDHKLFCALPNLTIGNTSTLVLAQVLDPRFVHEAFDEARSVRRVMKELPEIRAVAATHFAHGLHGGDEFGSFGGLNAVFDRHHDRPAIGFRGFRKDRCRPIQRRPEVEYLVLPKLESPGQPDGDDHSEGCDRQRGGNADPCCDLSPQDAAERHPGHENDEKRS